MLRMVNPRASDVRARTDVFDRKGPEQMHYIARPELTHDSAKGGAGGQVVLKLSPAWRDDTTH